MREYHWQKFPYDTGAFDYSGGKLARHWARLHGGDQEALPSAQQLEQRLGAKGARGREKELIAELEDAWRAFHSGELQAAFKQGRELGLAGLAVASKAVGVYAHGVEPNAERAELLLERAVKSAAATLEQLPDDANAHYFYAFLLGRLSQRISVMSAIAFGYAPKIKHSLERALELQPKHADAHLALGLYHAEIIDKLGALAGSLTYGVSRDASLAHLERALDLNGHSPTTLIEYANGLQLLFGKEKHTQIAKIYRRAAKATPMDAMERLDVEKARTWLEAAA